MPNLVKANANLTNGGIAVMRQSVNATDDGTLELDIDYVCLTAYKDRWNGRFRIKSTPPTGYPSAVGALSAQRPPTLYSVNIQSENGLTYFEAKYSTGLSSEVTITENEELRTCSGIAIIRYTSQLNYSTVGGTGTTVNLNLQRNVSFDYISKSKTISSKNATFPSISQDPLDYLGPIFNLNIAGPGADSGQFLGATRKVVTTKSKTSSTRGEYTYNQTTYGIYELPALE